MYRENCIYHKDVEPFGILMFANKFELAKHIADLIATDPRDLIDDATYSYWVDTWKTCYKEISEFLRWVKYDVYIENQNDQSGRDKAAHAIKRLANTMLNARQFNKDYRFNRSEHNNVQ